MKYKTGDIIWTLIGDDITLAIVLKLVPGYNGDAPGYTLGFFKPGESLEVCPFWNYVYTERHSIPFLGNPKKPDKSSLQVT